MDQVQEAQGNPMTDGRMECWMWMLSFNEARCTLGIKYKPEVCEISEYLKLVAVSAYNKCDHPEA